MAVTIIYSSKDNLTPAEKYMLTKSSDIISVKDIADGMHIDIAVMCEFRKEDKDGNIIDLTSFATPHYESVYCTQSDTFRDNLTDIVSSIFDNSISDINPCPIIKFSGTSKSGRNFVDCKLDIATYNERQAAMAKKPKK